MNYANCSIGDIQNRAGATVRRGLVAVTIRDEGILKVPGSWDGNGHCACALLLIPSFLQLLILDPETPESFQSGSILAFNLISQMDTVLRFSWFLLAMENAVLPGCHACG